MLKMTSDKCVLCCTPITADNDSEEHIFANSVGGWATVKGFICEQCNSRKGKTWDAELARQFAWLALMTGIKRDRGEIQPVTVKTVSGTEYRMQPDGSMIPRHFKFSRESVGEQIKISFVARDFEELNTKLTELKKKYPQMDIDGAKGAAKMTTAYLDEPLMGSMPEGGPDVGRSIIMTALAYASDQGIDPEICNLVLPFLRSPSEMSLPRYGWSYLIDAIKDRKPGAIFHCVSLYGAPETRQLYAYVELFSYGRWHIELSDQYAGPQFQMTYAIDPTEAREINVEVDWERSIERIGEVTAGDGFNNSNIEKAMDSLMPELLNRSSKRAYALAFNSAVQAVLAEIGLTIESEVSPEMQEVISRKIYDEMAPFIKTQLSPGRLPISEQK